MSGKNSLDKNCSPVLDVKKLSVAYKVRGGEIEAVQNVTFDIQPGESYGIVGESGCGKSTVAWAIINFLGENGYVKRGSIEFQGQSLVNKTNEELRRLRGNKVAMVYQDPMQSLNPSLRIERQMTEVLRIHQGIKKLDAQDRCIEMLKRVHMPDAKNVLRRYPHQLSGGQQQRVVIAMALLNNPALLIMDEPTTALDVTVEAAVLDIIQELREELETAIMFITHNLGVVARVTSRVGVMYAGEMVERAKVEDIFSSPKHPYTQGLIRCVPKLGSDKKTSTLYPIAGRVPAPDRRPHGCIFEPRCYYAEEVCSQTRPSLRQVAGTASWVSCHLHQKIDAGAWQPPESMELPEVRGKKYRSEPILKVEKLKKYYEIEGSSLKDVLGLGDKRYVKALEGVTFDVPRGKTLGIVGESGCGKSTLINTIIGLQDSTEGRASFLGFDITNDISSRDMDLVRKMQMVFQNPDSTMNPSFSVGQQIARPMVRFKTVSPDQIYAEVVRLLRAVRLGESYYKRLPRQLSGGEKQRVGIARALACRPDLVLCDEPVSALDVSVQAAIINLLLNLQEEFDTTLIFISHDLSVVRFFSEFICVMYLGQIMEIGPVESIYLPPYHPYTEALLSAVPIPDPTAIQKRIQLEGTVPSALDPPSGCRFRTRCPHRRILSDPEICNITPSGHVMRDHRINCHIPLSTLKEMKPVVHFYDDAVNG